jgi:predicted tellurium resistance membrane protein TerC
VIVLRAIVNGLGAALVSRFGWVLYFFGAFLVLTGIKMWMIADHMPDIANHPLLKFLRRHLRITPALEGSAFFVRRADPASGRMVWWATPLFLALCLVEFADLIFAVDSVPAIFAITTDPYIVYTSNIFAILGLRALYFALAAMIHRFAYLKYALALVLVFIGAKILLHGFIGKMPAAVSLGVTFGLIAGGVLVSLWKTTGGRAAGTATFVNILTRQGPGRHAFGAILAAECRPVLAFLFLSLPGTGGDACRPGSSCTASGDRRPAGGAVPRRHWDWRSCWACCRRPTTPPPGPTASARRSSPLRWCWATRCSPRKNAASSRPCPRCAWACRCRRRARTKT